MSAALAELVARSMGRPLGPAVEANIVECIQRGARRYALTPRMTDAALAMAEGLSQPEIAAKLGITKNTADYHVAHVFVRTGISCRAGAVARLMSAGMLP